MLPAVLMLVWSVISRQPAAAAAFYDYQISRSLSVRLSVGLSARSLRNTYNIQ